MLVTASQTTDMRENTYIHSTLPKANDDLNDVALAHSLAQDCRSMVVAIDAEADETRKHPLPKFVSLQQSN